MTAWPPASMPDEAWAVALSLLPGCGQHRLAALLDATGNDAESAWRRVIDPHAAPELSRALGRSDPSLVSRWCEVAMRSDPQAVWKRLVDAGVGVWLRHQEGYPLALTDDPDPPPILFWQGERQALDRPAVAIVGTRRCTAYGTDVARCLGRDLAASGVAVVSGLALGIDGAAHEGALAGGPSGGPPIGVVGSGLDVVYPGRHRGLWRRVADAGLLLTEAPPGAAPEGWRFPRRNRILAGLSSVVVVVESHASGGSLSTVRNAIDRGITVMAVPGSVRSPSSAGTNRLLADGVAPVTDAQDVLVALSLEGIAVGGGRTSPQTSSTPPSDAEPPVLAAVDWTPTATEDILRRTGLTIGAATTQLHRLEAEGRIRRRGSWWERR